MQADLNKDIAKEPSCILSLPDCVLEQILLKLAARDIINFSATCSGLKGVALAETLWAGFARGKWGGVTQLENWISVEPQGIFQSSECPSPRPVTYRYNMMPCISLPHCLV